MPERTRNTSPTMSSVATLLHSLRKLRIAAITARMTTVRMNVARFELIEATPTLSSMAVSPANKGLSRGDQLSVLELGQQSVTHHSGLMAWNVKTRWFLPRKTVANSQRNIWLVGL